MFQALKRHIMRERQKKKEEQEVEAEVERLRKEIEAQQKQHVMTIGENREQIAKLEQLLTQLKEDKHQLFVQLKKVLHEDDARRRQSLVRQQESSGEVLEVIGYGGLAPPPLSVSAAPLHQIMLQPSYSVADRNTLYKVPPSHTLLPPGSMKRARSPSPPPPPVQPPPQLPPASVYTSGYGQKSSVLARPPYQKSSLYGGFYQPGTTGATQYTYSGPQFASSSGRSEQPLPMESVPQGKHAMYLPQPLPRTSISQPYMHGSLDHKPSSHSEVKFYVPAAVGTHVPIHGGAIPIQQPAQGVKTGGITSGFPIRPSSSAPHVVSSPASHSVYASQPPSGSRLVYSQAGLTPNRYGQREV